MSVKAKVRDGKFADFRIIVEYDEFIGDRRLDLQRKELIVGDFGDDLAVGYGRLTNCSFFDWPFLSILCTKRAFRRSGIGTLIVQEAARRCSQSRLYTSTEADNVEMIGLMKKLNCEEIGFVDNLNLDGKRELLFRVL